MKFLFRITECGTEMRIESIDGMPSLDAGAFTPGKQRISIEMEFPSWLEAKREYTRIRDALMLIRRSGLLPKTYP